MAASVGDLLSRSIDGLVRGVVVPVTGVIPVLVSKGLLLVAFAGLWLGFGIALVTNPAALDDWWRAITQLPLPVQALAWLLFLPVLAGLWVWQTDWPLVVRWILIVGIAAWNLMVFNPRPGRAPQVVTR
jgi:hypothetical protein